MTARAAKSTGVSSIVGEFVAVTDRAASREEGADGGNDGGNDSTAAIEERAGRIPDDAARAHYLEKLPVHVRVGELARHLEGSA